MVIIVASFTDSDSHCVVALDCVLENGMVMGNMLMLQ